MRSLIRIRRWLLAASCGGILMGLSTAVYNLNFAEIFTAFLTQFLTLLVQLILGTSSGTA